MFFSLATSNKFAIKNNRLMQMSLTFHETLIKTNRKYENFKARLSSFSGIKKLKLERKGGGGGGGGIGGLVHFILIIFVYTHKFPI